MQLRDYQEESTTSIYEEWKENNSTLLVLPTGCGKTIVFSEVIRRNLPKRALVLVHRYELADQAMRKIQAMGMSCELEMANYRARTGLSNTFFADTPMADVIVSTVQTQNSGEEGEERMFRFKPSEFGTVIVDEAHHATSPSWVKVLDYYRLNPDLRILGVTATPDRADEEALGKVFQTVAYDYEILDAIQHGWLVPIEQQMVQIDGLDFSQMRTTAGDLNGADLAEVMEAEKNLHGVVSASIDIIGNRRTLVFAVSVKQAEMYAEIFNRHREGMADWVSGKTPKEDRKEKLNKFKDGRTQVMVNVGVLTEGFDAPSVEVIVQARPTKSRCLYSQMVGRSTRPLPGIVDGLATAEERVQAIANSAKSSCLIIDFAGNSGRHKLVTTADILGGKVSDEAIERAERKAKAKGKPVNMAELLEEEEEQLRIEIEEAKRREAARKAKLIGRATYSARTINPFDIFQLEPERERGWDSGKTLSEKQTQLLLKQGINPDSMPYSQAKQLINHLFHRWNNKLATLKQCALLQKKGYDTKDLTMSAASNIIDSLAKNGWNRERADASRLMEKAA